MYRLIIFILIVLPFQLHSLEIRVNGSHYENYSEESLRELSYNLPGPEDRGLYLYELLPLMENMNQFRFISGDYIMETDMNETIYISTKDDIFTLHSENFGVITLPTTIELEGRPSQTEKLTIWLDEEHQSVIKEIDLFARLHKIQVQYRIEKNIKSLLEYSIFNQSEIPDLIIYNSGKLNSIIPLLSTIDFKDSQSYIDGSAFSRNEQLKALPYQMSRTLLLNESSGGENIYFTSDFKSVSLLYPLLIDFGMGTNFDINSDALHEALNYLRDLYKKGILKLSENPEEDFIKGEIDSIYTESTILSRIPEGRGRSGLAIGPSMLNYTLLSIPRNSKNREYSRLLLSYLTDFGVQQRINPQSGYLPYNRDTYPLLKESRAKELLLEDLQEAFWLAPEDGIDRLNAAIKRTLRLIINGRLTLEEGISEISVYMDDINNQ